MFECPPFFFQVFLTQTTWRPRSRECSTHPEHMPFSPYHFFFDVNQKAATFGQMPPPTVSSVCYEFFLRSYHHRDPNHAQHRVLNRPMLSGAPSSSPRLRSFCGRILHFEALTCLSRTISMGRGASLPPLRRHFADPPARWLPEATGHLFPAGHKRFFPLRGRVNRTQGHRAARPHSPNNRLPRRTFG